MTSEEMTADERELSAVLLQKQVQALGWELLLDDQGGLLVRIGADMPGVPQQVVLSALFMFASEYERALRAGQQVH